MHFRVVGPKGYCLVRKNCRFHIDGPNHYSLFVQQRPFRHRGILFLNRFWCLKTDSGASYPSGRDRGDVALVTLQLARRTLYEPPTQRWG
jgi:hypothetical protein